MSLRDLNFFHESYLESFFYISLKILLVLSNFLCNVIPVLLSFYGPYKNFSHKRLAKEVDYRGELLRNVL